MNIHCLIKTILSPLACFFIYFLALALLAYAPPLHSGYYYAKGSADDYSDLTFFWRCEGTTLGADDYSAGDTTASGNGTVAINTDAMKIGTNGIDSPTIGDYYLFNISSDDIVSGTEGIIGFWLYINSWAEYTKIVRILASTGYIRAQIRNSDEMRFTINDGSSHDFTTTTSPLSTATWYFVELVWKDSSNLVEIYISEDDGTRDQQLSTTGTAWATPTAESALRIGCVEGNADVYIDNFIISNDSTRNLYLIRNETSSPK